MCDDEQFDPDVSGRDSSISKHQQAKFRIEVSYVRQVSR